MPHPNADTLHFHRDLTAADRLERIARRPLQPRRDALRLLAERLRGLGALQEHELPPTREVA